MTASVRRLLLLTSIGASMLGIYLIIGHAPHSGVTVVSMPDIIPFVPALALPYLGLLNAAWLLPLAIRNDRLFHRCIVAGIVAYLLVAPWWILCPTILPRPPVGGEWWNAPYRTMCAIDAPTNVCPCAHVLGPLIAAWYTARDRPSWRWWLTALVVLGIPTIALTWQHRPVDILLGMLCAMVGIISSRWICRLPARNAVEPKATTDQESR